MRLVRTAIWNPQRLREQRASQKTNHGAHTKDKISQDAGTDSGLPDGRGGGAGVRTDCVSTSEVFAIPTSSTQASAGGGVESG
jgi:hypothetical protein